MEVIAEIGDGQAAYAQCLELKPDLVILDVMLPGLNGTELLRRLHKTTQRHSCPRIFRLSQSRSHSHFTLKRSLRICGKIRFLSRAKKRN